MILGLLLAGCTRQADTARAPHPAPTPPSAVPQEEIWEALYIHEARVGYAHTRIYREACQGEPVLRTEQLTCLRMLRFGVPLETRIFLSSVEAPEGTLRQFTSRTDQQMASMVTEGEVVGNRLRITTTTLGKTTTDWIPWSPDCGGLFAVEQGLRRRPLEPGEHRTLRSFMPMANELATTELAAGPFESVRLLDGTRRLLRIEAATSLGRQTIRQTFWCDRTGQIWKTRSDMLGVESYRTSRAVALQQAAPAELDIIGKLAVRVERALERPHQTKRVRYRVRLEGRDPASVFTIGPAQEVRRIDASSAEVTVWAIRPGQPGGNPEAGPDPPSDADRLPSNLVQSDHPKIVAAARQAVGSQTDPWQIALALERAAHELIRTTDLSLGFASAAEVIESSKGDCSEHAVLLAALARAQGLPARVAVGLIYQQKSFFYHMWTEVFLEGRWIGLDATLAQGGIGAAHLKLAHTNLHGPSALSGILPIAQVAGRLKIEILEAH